MTVTSSRSVGRVIFRKFHQFESKRWEHSSAAIGGWSEVRLESVHSQSVAFCVGWNGATPEYTSHPTCLTLRHSAPGGCVTDSFFLHRLTAVLAFELAGDGGDR
jgi:hypothetical protein